MVEAYIALGANLGDPVAQVEDACEEIGRIAGTQLIARSPWYQTKAVGPGDQPDYINGVVKVWTDLEPLALLHELQAIEQHHGRQRHIKWGARTLDLDLLIYADQKITSAELTVPHPHLHERNFVVYPLADIAGELLLPSGVLVSQLRAKLADEGIRRLVVGESV